MRKCGIFSKSETPPSPHEHFILEHFRLYTYMSATLSTIMSATLSVVGHLVSVCLHADICYNSPSCMWTQCQENMLGQHLFHSVNDIIEEEKRTKDLEILYCKNIGMVTSYMHNKTSSQIIFWIFWNCTKVENFTVH